MTGRSPLIISYEKSAAWIARGTQGDCCILCGLCRVDLPVDHGCRPNLPTELLSLVWRPIKGETLLGLLRSRKQRQPPAPPPGGYAPVSPGAAERRLTGILRTLKAAPMHERNSVLHWCACRVGEMLAADHLPDAHSAAHSLWTVALEIGLDTSEIPGTIRSGFGKSGVRL